MSGPIVTPLPPRGVAIRRAPNTLRSTISVKHCTGTISVPKALWCGWWKPLTLYWYNIRPRNSVHYCWLYHNIARRTCKSTRFSNTQKKNFVEKSGLSSFFENEGAVVQGGLVEFSRVTSLTNALCAHITPAPLLLNLG